MKLRIFAEDEDGNVYMEIVRQIEEEVNERGEKVLIHPAEDDLVYKTLNGAEDRINNIGQPNF